MVERTPIRRSFPAPVPVSDRQKVPCSSCARRVDPLRASRVAIYGGRFHYFCSPECRVRFAPDAAPRSTLPSPASTGSAPSASTPSIEPPSPSISADSESSASDPLIPPAALASEPRRQVPGAGWLGAAIGLGGAGAVSTLPGPPRWLPAVLCVIGCAAWLIGSGRGTRRSVPARVAPLVAAGAALLGWWLAPSAAVASARIAGVVCAAAAACSLWVGRKQPSEVGLATPEALGELDASGELRAALKPGEELVLRAGDRVGADVVIRAGRARVEPWPGSRLRLTRAEGDGILAGARLTEGALRAVVRWVDHDRAWARLRLDPSRRADRHVAHARLADRLATGWAGVLGVTAGATSLALDVHPVLALGYAAAAASALAGVELPELVALHVRRGLGRLEQRGICLRSAAALDRAGRTATVVFCDRGTLLSGELSVASVEPAGDLDEAELLALLAGAHGGAASPVGAALSRALSAQKLRADATRSPNHLPGLGVTAVASNGQALVAGTRALLLERRISVAAAETRIAELETLGRTVLLVALDGRWVGLVAFQDGLRPGARAATQCLLDAGVEPVLLSGEARETCKALARHIGIEHVRPEVLPGDRAAEVRRLARAGGTLAVVGSSIDDAALSAAPLSLNIDPRGGPLERCDIDVVSGDVRDAAAAIQLARELHARTRGALIAATLPSAFGLLLLLSGLPAWCLPLLGVLGCALGTRRLDEPPRDELLQEAASTPSRASNGAASVRRAPSRGPTPTSFL